MENYRNGIRSKVETKVKGKRGDQRVISIKKHRFFSRVPSYVSLFGAVNETERISLHDSINVSRSLYFSTNILHTNIYLRFDLWRIDSPKQILALRVKYKRHEMEIN